MELTALKFEIKDNVGVVTLAQDERGNPFDGAFCEDMKKISIACETNPEVRAVLFRGEGRFFSVGGDLKTFLGNREGLPDFILEATSNIHMAVSRFARGSAPVVLAAHAPVVGGAVSLTAGADFVLASSNASFYAAFAGIGFSPDCGMSYYLPRRVGVRRAAEFLMRNQTWSAEQAKDYGLINEVVAEDVLDEQAFALAAELAAGPDYVYGNIKRLLLSTFEQPLEAQLEQEARSLASCAAQEKTWNALNAVAKREVPKFH